MKTFRMIGMALLAVLMCVNFASCSSSDDDEPSENGGGETIVSGKRITKIVYESEVGTSTRTFSYDAEGKLVQSTEIEEWGTDTYKYIWGDDVVKLNHADGGSYILTLKNGLAQSGDGDIFTYNQSNRFIKGEGDGETVTAIWSGDKLMSISNENGDATITYEKSCQKGYFPFIPTMIDFSTEYLFVVHPEIAGMRTTQLPASITWTDKYGSETSTFTYEFDKEGYISKLTSNEAGSIETYTITWQ